MAEQCPGEGAEGDEFNVVRSLAVEEPIRRLLSVRESDPWPYRWWQTVHCGEGEEGIGLAVVQCSAGGGECDATQCSVGGTETTTRCVEMQCNDVVVSELVYYLSDFLFGTLAGNTCNARAVVTTTSGAACVSRVAWLVHVLSPSAPARVCAALPSQPPPGSTSLCIMSLLISHSTLRWGKCHLRISGDLGGGVNKYPLALATKSTTNHQVSIHTHPHPSTMATKVFQTPSPTLVVGNLETKTKKPELRSQLYALFTPYGRM